MTTVNIELSIIQEKSCHIVTIAPGLCTQKGFYAMGDIPESERACSVAPMHTALISYFAQRFRMNTEGQKLVRCQILFHSN